MAQSFISELGDKLGGDGVANTEGEHVKTISAAYYKRNDSGTVSNQSLQTAIDGKADDSAVVHLAGDETITGEKIFYNKWPYYRSSCFTNTTKTFFLSSGTSYDNWAENLKDGNHFRHWKLSFGELNDAYFIFSIGLRSAWSRRNSIGFLQKTISCLRTTAVYSSYTQIIGHIAEEYRISDLKQETTETGNNWYIDIVSNIPTSNNSLYAILELSASNNWNLPTSFTVSSTYDIIEGWPAWAGDINTTPRLQSNGINVLLVGDTITNVAIGSASGKPLITTTNGVVTTGAFGTSAGQFAEGNTVGKVTATEKTDSAEYKLLATASASPTSGALTEAVYDTGITMNPSTNTLTANLSGIATYAKALDPQMILNTTLYKVPVISADKEVRWSGAPGASGSTTELTYDNTDSKNLLSVNVTGYATSLEHAFAGSTVNETPIINVSGSTDGFKLTYGATTSDLGITKLYTTDDANAKLSFGNMVSSTYKEAISIANGSATVTGSLSGNASTATSAGKLTTARKSYVNLGTASTSSTFDWSGDTVLPINGTLAVGHGGTGKTSVTANNFLVGNGTSALVEKTPAQVLNLIDAVSSSSLADVAFDGKYSSLTGKPSLSNDSITLNANTTIYITIMYYFNLSRMVGSLLTNVHMKGGINGAWNNDSIEVIHSIGSDIVGLYNLTNHIISCNLKSDIEFSYYLSSSGPLILKLKNNTSNRYSVSVSATVLGSSDITSFYQITEIEADTTAIAQSGTVTNVWYNHALVSEKIGKTNSATTGIDYTSKGNTSTPIYLDNGEFKECTSISTPYEWVTAFPSTYTAGKVYLL